MSSKNHEKPLEYNPYSFMNRLCVDKIPIRAQFYQPRTDIKDARKLEFQLVSPEKFLVSGSFHVFEEKMKIFFKVYLVFEWFSFFLKSMNGTFVFSEKAWSFPISEIKKVLASARSGFPEFTIEEIPNYVLEGVKPLGSFLAVDNSFAIVFEEQDDKKTLDSLPQFIRNSLYPFQKQTIEMAIQHKARILLCDELGMGKTLQSIALAWIYREAWPLLIIAPGHQLLFWEAEISTYLKNCVPEMQVFLNSGTIVRKSIEILIISFENASKNIEKIQALKPQFAICDEIKQFGNHKSNITKFLVPFLQKIKHLVLISSAATLEDPKELFPPLRILKPAVFKEFSLFAERYCQTKNSNFGLGIEYFGNRNLQELRLIMNSIGFSRKRRAECSKELKEKTRKNIPIVLDQVEAKKNTVANLKIKAAREYLKYMITLEPKIIIFINTEEAMNELSAFLKQIGFRFVEFEPKQARALWDENRKEFLENNLVRVSVIRFEVLKELQEFKGVSFGIFLEVPEKKEDFWFAEGKLFQTSGHPLNFHYLIIQNSNEETLYSEFLNLVEGFDEKRLEFIQFLKTEEPIQEDGIIENLDKIEELINEWEEEKRRKKMENRKRKMPEVVESGGEESAEVFETDAQGKTLRKKTHLEKAKMFQ